MTAKDTKPEQMTFLIAKHIANIGNARKILLTNDLIGKDISMSLKTLICADTRTANSERIHTNAVPIHPNL